MAEVERVLHAGDRYGESLADHAFAPAGALYRIDTNHRPTRLDDGPFLLDGIAWSPDNRTMYVADSRREVVCAHDFGIEEGRSATVTAAAAAASRRSPYAG